MSGTTFTTPTLIADVYQPDIGAVDDNGSVDSIPSFTMVNGFPASVCLELQSTTGGLLISRMSTAERLALNVANGTEVYDTDVESFFFYEDGGWVSIPGVILPTSSDDIAIFTDDAGTLADSDVSLYTSFGNNIFIGASDVGNKTLSGQFNVAFGSAELLNNLTGGGGNTFFGSNSGSAMTTGVANISVGSGNLSLSEDAQKIIAVGNGILDNLVSGGNETICIGQSILNLATTTSQVIAIGANVGQYSSSIGNCVFIGDFVASNSNPSILSGLVGIGQSALSSVDTACANLVALGNEALRFATTATACVAVGTNSLSAITDSATGTQSTACGDNALANATTAVATTALGSSAGATQTQYTSCTFIGEDADATVNNLSHACAIGAGASVAVSNAMVLGPSGTFVGINNSSPIANLDVRGSFAFTPPTVVNAFPYTINALTDNLVCCFPEGVTGNKLILPDANVNNLGRGYYISNSSQGSDVLFLSTVGGQNILPSALDATVGKLYIASGSTGNYFWRAV